MSTAVLVFQRWFLIGLCNRDAVLCFPVPWGRYSHEIAFILSDANILSLWGIEWTVISFRHKLATVMSLFSKVLKASSAENLQTDRSVPSMCRSGNRMRCSVFSLEEVCWNELREDQGGDGKKESAGRCLHPNEDTYVSRALRLFVLNEQKTFGLLYLP